MPDLSGNQLETAGQVLSFSKPWSAGATVSFKAYVKSLSNNWQSNWSSDDVFGRMDQLHKFKNTVRNGSVSWELPAESEEDAKNLQKKVSMLVMMLYPNYLSLSKSATAMTTPPFIRIKFGNLFTSQVKGYDGLLIKVNSLTHDVDFEPGMFGVSGKPQMNPKVSSLNLSFDVIHEHPLGWDHGYGRARFGFEQYPYGKSNFYNEPLANLLEGLKEFDNATENTQNWTARRKSMNSHFSMVSEGEESTNTAENNGQTTRSGDNSRYDENEQAILALKALYNKVLGE